MIWNKTSEKLPEKHGRYLVFSPFKGEIQAILIDFAYPIEKVNIAYYDPYENKWSYNSYNTYGFIPKYWKEIDTPPEG